MVVMAVLYGRPARATRPLRDSGKRTPNRREWGCWCWSRRFMTGIPLMFIHWMNWRCIAGVIVYAGICFAGTAVTPAMSAESAQSIKLQAVNPSTKRLIDAPVTFGQAFRRGDVPPGKQVHCVVGDRWAQVDVKRRYRDGSLRFAVVSMVLPTLAPGESKELELVSAEPRPTALMPPVTLKDLLATDFDTVVTFRFPDGAKRATSARELLTRRNTEPTTWLKGHTASEWLVEGPPTDADGQPDKDLLVRFAVRAYAGCKQVRVSATVENCWDTWAENIRYDMSVAVDGKQVFAEEAVDHRRLSRWRMVFSWPHEAADQIHVAHDFVYLASTGALPNYDDSLDLAPLSPEQERALSDVKDGRWRIMGRGSLCAYMPTTGGRPEIAPYPTWAVRYLLTQDPAAKRLVLANGDLAGSWPVHVRARKTGRVMTIDERPEFWLDDRGKDRPEWQLPRHLADPRQTRLSPDLAHQGSFAFVPYLVTGDHFYLEEAYFWANYCLLATWPHPRGSAEGILSGQIRGNAWSMRNIADAAWIASDGDPEAVYFDEKIRNNLADRIHRMYGPPEHSKLGFWGERTTKDARIQNPADPDWMVVAPWEHDYLIWSFQHLVDLGYPDAAKPRDYLLRWRIGALTNSPDFDPRLAAPYRFVVGKRSKEGKVVFYDDWKTLGRENARFNEPSLPNAGNDYAYSARAAVICGVDGGFAKALEALDWLERQFPDLRVQMRRNPAWAIQPREK